MDSISSGFLTLHAYPRQCSKSTLTVVAITSVINAAVSAVFCAFNAGISAGPLLNIVTVLPPILPICLLTIFTVTAYFSLEALKTLQAQKNERKDLHPESRPMEVTGVDFQTDEKPARIARLTEAANKGDREAMYALGLHYENENKKIAFEWISKANHLDYPEAGRWLGQFYYTKAEHHLKKSGAFYDEKKTVELIGKAAEYGNKEAQCEYGSYFLKGIGVEKNEKEAVDLFKKSAEQGYLPAKIELYKLLLDQGTETDRFESMKHLKKLAEQNIMSAQYLYGNSLLKSAENRSDMIESVKWLEKSIDRNPTDASLLGEYYSEALISLSHCYYKGNGCEKSLNKALELMHDAVTLGKLEKSENIKLFSAQDLIALADNFLKGTFCSKDSSAARALLKPITDSDSIKALRPIEEPILDLTRNATPAKRQFQSK